MADTNFFTEKNMQDDIQANVPDESPNPYTFGEKTYTKDEMEKLVGLGEIAREAEEKYSTRIDRVWPEYTKAQQRLAEIDRAKETQTVKEIETKSNQGQQLNPEEIRRQAVSQLAELMRDPVVQQEVRQTYINERTSEKLNESVNSLIAQAKEDGKPVPTRDDIFQHMVDTGIKDPQKAYKDLYENELDEWKERQLGKIRQPGLVTNTTSTAGSKNPAPIKITKANLSELLHEEILRSASERG